MAFSYSFPNFEPISCFMSSSNCCFLTLIQVPLEIGKLLWYSRFFKNFPICCDPHSQRLYRNRCFSGIPLLTCTWTFIVALFINVCVWAKWYLCLFISQVVIVALFISLCQNLETLKKYFNWWMYKQTVIHQCNGILFIHRKKCGIKPWKDMLKRKKPI